MHTTLLKVTLDVEQSGNKSYDPRIKDLMNDAESDQELIPKSAYKTIHVIPGEAVKLTPNELKPKHLSIDLDRLMYSLVSGKPKYGKISMKCFI